MARASSGEKSAQPRMAAADARCSSPRARSVEPPASASDRCTSASTPLNLAASAASGAAASVAPGNTGAGRGRPQMARGSTALVEGAGSLLGGGVPPGAARQRPQDIGVEREEQQALIQRARDGAGHPTGPRVEAIGKGTTVVRQATQDRLEVGDRARVAREGQQRAGVG